MQASLLEHPYSEYRILEKCCVYRGDVYCPTRVTAVIRTGKKEDISMGKWRNIQFEWLSLPDQSRRSCPTHTKSLTLVYTKSCSPLRPPTSSPTIITACVSNVNCLLFFLFYSLLSFCSLPKFEYLIISLVFRPNKPVPLPNWSLS